MRDLLLEHRAPATPVVIGRDVGGAGERITVTPWPRWTSSRSTCARW